MGMPSFREMYSRYRAAIISSAAIVGFVLVVWPLYQTQHEILSTLRNSPQFSTKMARIEQLDLRDVPQLGESSAKVVLVELSDYQCAFCQRHSRQTAPAIREEYVKSGKIRLAFIDTPLEVAHPFAMEAAEASHCAGDQGAYWSMHDNLFAQTVQSPEDVVKAAEATSLKMLQFQECLRSGKYSQRIGSLMTLFENAGIKGTPYFLIGVEKRGSTSISIKSVIIGAQPLGTFRNQLDDALRGA